MSPMDTKSERLPVTDGSDESGEIKSSSCCCKEWKTASDASAGAISTCPLRLLWMSGEEEKLSLLPEAEMVSVSHHYL